MITLQIIGIYLGMLIYIGVAGLTFTVLGKYVWDIGKEFYKLLRMIVIELSQPCYPSEY